MCERGGISITFCKTYSLFNIFLFALILLFAADAHTIEDSWVYVSEREDNLWFINTDSTMCEGNTCKALVKMQPIAEKYEYTIELNEYNCVEMKYKTLRITKYDSNRNTMRSIAPGGQGWNYVVPASVGKELYDFVCKKAPNHKEQLSTNEKDEKQEVETKGTTVKDKKETSLQSQEPSEAIFTVQVGAFKNSSYAEALMAWLKEKGYSAYITLSGSKKGRNFIRYA